MFDRRRTSAVGPPRRAVGWGGMVWSGSGPRGPGGGRWGHGSGAGMAGPWGARSGPQWAAFAPSAVRRGRMERGKRGGRPFHPFPFSRPAADGGDAVTKLAGHDLPRPSFRAVARLDPEAASATPSVLADEPAELAPIDVPAVHHRKLLQRIHQRRMLIRL